MSIREGHYVESESKIRADIRKTLVRSSSEFYYENPKVDHLYRVKGTIIVKKNSTKNSFLDVVQKRAKSSVDPRKYSTIFDWRKNKGFKIPKDDKGGFIDMIMKEKKKIPAPSKYNAWLRPKILGNYKNNESKQTVIDSIALEKAYVPAPNKYDCFKSLAEESKLRQIPRVHKVTKSLKVKEKPTPAPGAKMTEENLNFLLKKPIFVKIDKSKNQSFLA